MSFAAVSAYGTGPAGCLGTLWGLLEKQNFSPAALVTAAAQCLQVPMPLSPAPSHFPGVDGIAG
jgi:hypothetical protein